RRKTEASSGGTGEVFRSWMRFQLFQDAPCPLRRAPGDEACGIAVEVDACRAFDHGGVVARAPAIIRNGQRDGMGFDIGTGDDRVHDDAGLERQLRLTETTKALGE